MVRMIDLARGAPATARAIRLSDSQTTFSHGDHTFHFVLRRSDIEKTPGVCGGVACIAGTRIPVWVLLRAQQLGATDRRIREMYPALTQRDLHSAWHYVAAHEDEILQQIRENEDA